MIDRWESGGRHTGFIDYARVREFLAVHGIRIEDDVLIQDAGSRVLGPAIAQEAAEIEAALSG